MRTPPTPVLVAAGVVVAVVVVVALVVAGGEDEPEVAAEPTPAPPPTSTDTPTATPAPAPTAEPFEVRLVEADGLALLSTDNAAIVSRDSLPADERVAGDAAEIARAAFEQYLNAQFVDPDTRFGAEPIEALLTPAARDALTDEDRAALGLLDLDVAHVETGAAEADPVVTMHGDRPRNVTLKVAANLTVVAPDDTETPLRLRGQMLFVPTTDGWLVGAVDVRLVEEEQG